MPDVKQRGPFKAAFAHDAEKPLWCSREATAAPFGRTPMEARHLPYTKTIRQAPPGPALRTRRAQEPIRARIRPEPVLTEVSAEPGSTEVSVEG